MLASIFEKNGRIAELERFEYCSHGDDGDGQCDEYWSVCVIPADDPENFKEFTFLSEHLAMMFITENGYKELVL